MPVKGRGHERSIEILNFRDQIFQTINTHDLIGRNAKVLAAVSGGEDSMAMLHFLHTNGYSVAAAHCNFNLRGEESDMDAQLVEQYCTENQIEFYLKSFETREYCRGKKMSIQEGARELRYKWFQEVLTKHGFSKIATAHHLDDNIETYFINLIRGTGIKGLGGIPLMNESVVRPMLELRKQDIQEYVRSHDIPFREDQSNKDKKYLRNKIRHELIPILAEIHPDYHGHFEGLMEYNKQLWKVVRTEVDRLKGQVVKREGDRILIDLASPEFKKSGQLLLFHLLEEFEFSTGEFKEISKLISSQPGKFLIGKKFKIIRDRAQLIIEENRTYEELNIRIDKGFSHVKEALELNISELDVTGLNINPQSNFGFFDLDKIEFPIKIRNWRKGDKFIPLGMDQHKKLSDFFVDTKVDLFQKDRVPIMTSGDEIMWVLGHRISDKFKIEDSTKKVLKIEWLNE